MTHASLSASVSDAEDDDDADRTLLPAIQARGHAARSPRVAATFTLISLALLLLGLIATLIDRAFVPSSSPPLLTPSPPVTAASTAAPDHSVHINHSVVQVHVTATTAPSIPECESFLDTFDDSECCHYGTARYGGFWPVSRMLYMHCNISSRCQLRPFAMQLQSLSINAAALQRSVKHGIQLPFNDLWLSSNATQLPVSWPVNVSLYKWSQSPRSLPLPNTRWLRDRLLVLIGDSLDRHLLKAFCYQMGMMRQFAPATIRIFNGTLNPAYRPQWCQSPVNGFTVLLLHHYGVLAHWWPPTDINVIVPFTTKQFIEVHLPRALRLIGRNVSDITMVQVNSGLWDLHAKNASYRWDHGVHYDRWLPSARSQLMDPLIALFDRHCVKPQIIVRTCPPNKWHPSSRIGLQAVNDGLRSLAYEYRDRARVQLLDMAVVLAERQHWCYDHHHYSPSTELQHANLLLNLLYERRVQKKRCHIRGLG